LRSLANRSARTLPAKPAPTINQSYMYAYSAAVMA
jgi:hypothetical protein